MWLVIFFLFSNNESTITHQPSCPRTYTPDANKIKQIQDNCAAGDTAPYEAYLIEIVSALNPPSGGFCSSNQLKTNPYHCYSCYQQSLTNFITKTIEAIDKLSSYFESLNANNLSSRIKNLFDSMIESASALEENSSPSYAKTLQNPSCLTFAKDLRSKNGLRGGLEELRKILPKDALKEAELINRSLSGMKPHETISKYLPDETTPEIKKFFEKEFSSLTTRNNLFKKRFGVIPETDFNHDTAESFIKDFEKKASADVASCISNKVSEKKIEQILKSKKRTGNAAKATTYKGILVNSSNIAELVQTLSKSYPQYAKEFNSCRQSTLNKYPILKNDYQKQINSYYSNTSSVVPIRQRVSAKIRSLSTCSIALENNITFHEGKLNTDKATLSLSLKTYEQEVSARLSAFSNVYQSSFNKLNQDLITKGFGSVTSLSIIAPPQFTLNPYPLDDLSLKTLKENRQKPLDLLGIDKLREQLFLQRSILEKFLVSNDFVDQNGKKPIQDHLESLAKLTNNCAVKEGNESCAYLAANVPTNLNNCASQLNPDLFSKCGPSAFDGNYFSGTNYPDKKGIQTSCQKLAPNSQATNEEKRVAQCHITTFIEKKCDQNITGSNVNSGNNNPSNAATSSSNTQRSTGVQGSTQ